MNEIKSKLFSLTSNDFVKGLVLAVITVVLGAIQQGLTAHGVDFASYNWGAIGDMALSAGIAYLIKNYFSNANGQIVTPMGKIG